jgi:MPBQ/MSBQ methyltransferase
MITDGIANQYDRIINNPLIREYYNQSDFFNFGYWREDTLSPKEACENLLEELLASVPVKQGSILDVACGLGATTAYLLRYYRPADVVGINISHKQLARGMLNAPGCAFLQMDAVKLGFDDCTFDTIICVEAAFHFNTRANFLREAYRVLKPGGHLILSDILITRWASLLNRRQPRENWVGSLEKYENMYLQAGFQDVEVVDATAECWSRFYQHGRRWRREKFSVRKSNLRKYILVTLFNFVANYGLKNYVLISAHKK